MALLSHPLSPHSFFHRFALTLRLCCSLCKTTLLAPTDSTAEASHQPSTRASVDSPSPGPAPPKAPRQNPREPPRPAPAYSVPGMRPRPTFHRSSASLRRTRNLPPHKSWCPPALTLRSSPDSGLSHHLSPVFPPVPPKPMRPANILCPTIP